MKTIACNTLLPTVTHRYRITRTRVISSGLTVASIYKPSAMQIDRLTQIQKPQS